MILAILIMNYDMKLAADDIDCGDLVFDGHVRSIAQRKSI